MACWGSAFFSTVFVPSKFTRPHGRPSHPSIRFRTLIASQCWRRLMVQNLVACWGPALLALYASPTCSSIPSIHPFCTLIAPQCCSTLMVQNLDVLNNVHAITLSLKLPSFVNWIYTAQHTFSLVTVIIVRRWFETLTGFCLQLTTCGGRVHLYLTKQKKKDLSIDL